MTSIAGMTPSRVFEPQTAGELSAFVRETLDENLALAPIGCGTMVALGNRPSRYDVAIGMRGLNRVVDYEPDDQVVVVEAGITLDELQTQLGRSNQRLAVDPLDGGEMTIGGMLAANVYGPCALRYGTLKDLIVGIEFVRADGVLARAGGKVVKNVAGFDVSKLMVGSLGTLAIITKATFRVHPLPEASHALTFDMPAAEVFPFVLAMREAQLEPASLVARVDHGQCTVDVAFEGFTAGVTAQVETCLSLFDSHLCHPEALDKARDKLREAESRDRDDIARLKVSYKPSDFGVLAEGLERAVAFPALGVMWIEGNGSGSLAARDGNVRSAVYERMPLDWYGKVDAWGEPPPGFGLMQALKERFDPTRRLNPGRFVGGL